MFCMTVGGFGYLLVTSTTNEPNFENLCDSIYELLNIFEGSAQHILTISVSLLVVLIHC